MAPKHVSTWKVRAKASHDAGSQPIVSVYAFHLEDGRDGGSGQVNNKPIDTTDSRLIVNQMKQ